VSRRRRAEEGREGGREGGERLLSSLFLGDVKWCDDEKTTW